MLDKSCECHKRYSYESFNPCTNMEGHLNRGCECHIENRLNEHCPPSYRNDLVELLVDTSVYGVPGIHWCQWAYTAPGDMALYPYKVHIPDRGIGQYKASEIQNIREQTA